MIEAGVVALVVYYVLVVGAVFASSLNTARVHGPGWLLVFLVISIFWPVWVPFAFVAYEISVK